MNKKLISIILLVLTAMIWGFAFVAQTTGMDYIEPFTFSAARSLLGGFVMVLFFPLLERLNKDNTIVEDKPTTRRAAISCGIVLFFAMNFQQYGLLFTSAGKAGFITTLYVVIIPIIRKFMGHKIQKRTQICILGATFGLYLITVKENMSINMGDVLVFASAIFYSIHTLLLAHYSPRVDAVKLNAFQFIICGVLSLLPALVFEDISLKNIYSASVSIFYVGVLSSAVAYSFQIIGLRNIDSTLASLLSSLESIFAVIGGYLILGQILTRREIVGTVIVLIFTIAAQLPEGIFKNKLLKKV
ncbi:putative membrane protein [Peptoniphilus sp. ING2-D1G]|nr:putative membrane protein [Peptoniphilus sp. ING2-D1G]